MTTTSPTTAERATGSILGAFIGDALGLGPHWYYDLEEQHRDFGTWIDGYTTPKAGRKYHEGMQAGELSQSGLIMLQLLRSLVENGGYVAEDFTRRLDEDLFPQLDGSPYHGPGGYTNHSMRQVWQSRVKEGKPWGEVAGSADTSEAAERVLLLAALYATDPKKAARVSFEHGLLTQNDSLVAQQGVAFSCVISALVRGEALDEDLSGKLLGLLENGTVPFCVSSSLASSRGIARESAFGFPSPDALLLPSWVALSARDPAVRIEPAWKVSVVYGMSCQINFVLPAAYYLAARFPEDFESAVLHAINGGGQNMSRACLTGALSGTMVGVQGVPERFVKGLKDGAEILKLATRVGELVGKE